MKNPITALRNWLANRAITKAIHDAYIAKIIEYESQQRFNVWLCARNGKKKR